MSSFKHRSNKHKYLSTVQTVDELHKTYLSKIDDKRGSLPYKKEQLKELTNAINELERSDLRESYDQNLLKKKSNLKSQINELKLEIKKIEDNSEIMDYISKTGNILVTYYTGGKNQYNVADEPTDGVINFSDLTEATETETGNVTKKDPVDKLTELNLLSQQTRKVKNPVKKRKISHQTQSANTIFSYFARQERPQSSQQPEEPSQQPKQTVNKALLQEKYLYLTDKGYACGKSKTSKTIYCTNCNIEKILCPDAACYVCKECGETEHILIENEISTHKGDVEKQQKYPYKKVNHLKEKLNQFQSKESSDVPDDVCKVVIRDLKKKRIDVKKCVPPDVMSILKKHRFTTSYEHLQQIYCKVSGASPITLSRETEETIINMFQSMQYSFHKHCPESRSNFLNYAYVLNKLFRILEMDEHAKFFALLKSKDKLRDQDIIWNKVCKDMGWKFHSSFLK
jgi:hypothetical protein